MLERGLQVRRHAVDDIAIGALQIKPEIVVIRQPSRTMGKIDNHPPLQLHDDDQSITSKNWKGRMPGWS